MPDEPVLTSTERRYLAQRRREAELAAADHDRTRLRSVSAKIHSASDRYLELTARVATALCNATATAPPQRSARAGRAAPGTTDPTGTTVTATTATIASGCRTFAHLLGPCSNPDCTCNDDTDRDRDSLATIGTELDLEVTWITVHVDRLVQVRTTHPWQLPAAVKATAVGHSIALRRIVTAWDRARGHLPNDLLVQRADELDHLTRTMRALAGRLAQWAPTRHPQPELVYCRNHPDELAKYTGQRLCAACYQAKLRATDT